MDRKPLRTPPAQNSFDNLMSPTSSRANTAYNTIPENSIANYGHSGSLGQALTQSASGHSLGHHRQLSNEVRYSPASSPLHNPWASPTTASPRTSPWKMYANESTRPPVRSPRELDYTVNQSQAPAHPRPGSLSQHHVQSATQSNVPATNMANGEAGHSAWTEQTRGHHSHSLSLSYSQDLGLGGMAPHGLSHTHGQPLQPLPMHIQVPAVSVSPPSFRHVRSHSELTPVNRAQPKFRRALPEGGFMSPLAGLTLHLASTYRICNPAYDYQSSNNPRRVLTKPSEGALNHGYDNKDSDYILYVNDTLGIDEQRRYLVLDILGQGTFGQVVKCQNMLNKEIVAVKVIKNKPAYLNQSMMEVSILDHLNNNVDRNDEHNLLRLKDRFVHKEHLCLVFELLSSNLYELIKQNQFRGLSTNLVRVFARQLLDSLVVLKDARLIHCDLKPENILLKSLDSPVIKVIDFGSACHERQTVYTYIQSRFYRSPEVLMGLQYSTSIDMWSLGCIVVELFLGLPIFPGTSEYNQLSRIIDSLGQPPNWMLDIGKNTAQFFDKHMDEYNHKHYTFKTREQFSHENNCDEQPSKKYFPSTNLRDIIMNYPPPRKNMKKTDLDREMANRVAFVDFVQGLLNLNPLERWTPHQAIHHPFITEQPFLGPYKPLTRNKDVSARGSNPQVSVPVPSGGHPSHHSLHLQSVPHTLQPQTAPQPLPQPPMHLQPLQSMAPMQQPMQPLQPMQPMQPLQPLPPPPSEHHKLPNVPQGEAATAPLQSRYNYYSNASLVPPPYGNNPNNVGSTSSNGQQVRRRPRATTLGGNHLDVVPNAIQRATALMNPQNPIRAQPSPAYIPPPDIYAQQYQEHQAQLAQAHSRQVSQDHGVVRHLEDGLNYR